MPGYPDLEHRLNVAAFRHLGGGTGDDAVRHEENALGWLLKAGLTEPRVTSHVIAAWRPLWPATIDYLEHYWFSDRQDRVAAGAASEADIGEEGGRPWQDRLAHPDSAEYLLRQPSHRCLRLGSAR